MPQILRGISKNNIISQEIIDAQNSEFGLQIENIMHDILNANIAKQDFSKEVKALEKIIFDRLGLKTNIITNQHLAATIPFYSNKNTIFLDEMWRGNLELKDQNKVLRKAQDKQGFIDLKNAKVGGIFSEYENYVFMNFKKLINGYSMTPAELTAIILHELGHDFYVCEYSDRLESTNQVLANIAKEVQSAKKEKDLKYIYREIKKVNNDVTEAEVEILINGNKVIAGATWFKVIFGSLGVTGQLSNDTYDRNAFEQLADSFASRFGYGRPLVTGLDKLSDYYFNPEKNRAWAIIALLNNTFDLLSSIVGLLKILAGGGIALGLFMVLFLALSLLLAGDRFKDHTYDELKMRYQRVRNEQVAILKDLNLPKEHIRDMVANIYIMDNIIKETYKYSSAYNRLSNFLFSVNRKAKNSIQEQQLLEQLAHNDLFLKSAELAVLS